MAGSGRNLQDKDIVNLLSRLKDTEAEYPPELLSKRRAAFMAGVTALLSGFVAGDGGSGGPSAAGGSGGHVGNVVAGLTQIDKLIIALEVAVLTGMTAYLGVTAYNNRNYLQHLLFPSTPTVVQIAPSVFTVSPEPTASLIPTMTGTPTPTGTLQAPTSTTGGNNSTPQPAKATSTTHPGLHKGQTSQPPGTPSKK